MKRFLKIVALLTVTLFLSQGCTAVLGNLLGDYSDAREKVKGSIDLRYQSIIRHRIKGEEIYTTAMNTIMSYAGKLASNGQIVEAWEVYRVAFAFHRATEPSMLDAYVKYSRILKNIDNPDFKMPEIKELPVLKLPPKIVPPVVKPKAKKKKCKVCPKG